MNVHEVVLEQYLKDLDALGLGLDPQQKRDLIRKKSSRLNSPTITPDELEEFFSDHGL
jgi:hypothetical protein